LVGCISACIIVISVRRGIGITVTANGARPELSSCLVERGNGIRVFRVGTFEASLLENLLRLDTMITEEVVKENSDISGLGACRLVVRLERIFTLAQVLVVGLIAGYGRCVGCRGDGPPRGLGGTVIGEHRQFL
jgi:hypothetical protein